MNRKLLYCVIVATLLCGTAALAMVSTGPILLPPPTSPILVTPDAGVKGSGTLSLPNTGSVAKFDVNVCRYGTMALGSFRFTEFDSKGSCVNTLITKQISGLDIIGNVATVNATGVLNGAAAKITITALDDNPSGDNLRVVATTIPVGLSPTRQFVWQGGVFEGDLVVFNKAQIVGTARGTGTINHDRNVCKFSFSGLCTANGYAEGTIMYSESDPRIACLVPRPLAEIVVQKITLLKVNGKVATLQGSGTFNGKRAKVTLFVEDRYLPGTETFVAATDIFSIEAVLDTGAVYAVKGPLVSGDIVVTDHIKISPAM